MNIWKSRLCSLFSRSTSDQDKDQQIQALRHMMLSLIQEVEVLKSALTRHNILDEASYRQLRIQQMLNDHSAAGPSPWTNHSYYQYSLDEADFLRERLGMNESEIAEFRVDAQTLETQT